MLSTTARTNIVTFCRTFGFSRAELSQITRNYCVFPQSSVTVISSLQLQTRWQQGRCQSSRFLVDKFRSQSLHSDTGNTMDIPKKAFKEGSTCPASSRDTLRLYSMRFCPYALRTRLVLTHKNIAHETVNINLLSKPDWFLAKNPKGLVPVLEFNEKIVYESGICNDYLDAVYADVKLNSPDPYVRARHKILMDHYTPIALGFYKIAFAATEEDKARAIDRITSAMKRLEEHLEKDFFGGDQPGMLDFYAYPHLAMFDFIVDNRDKIAAGPVTGSYVIPRDVVPRLGTWLDRMKTLPAVVKNTEKTEDMVRFVHSWLGRVNIDYDAGLTSSKL